MWHITEATVNVLRPILEDRIISRGARSVLQFDTVGLLFVVCHQ